MGESVVACAEDRVMGMIRPCYGEHHGHQAPGPTPSERTTTNPKCVQYLREGRRCCTYRHDAKRLHASPLLLVLRLGRCGGGGASSRGAKSGGNQQMLPNTMFSRTFKLSFCGDAASQQCRQEPVSRTERSNSSRPEPRVFPKKTCLLSCTLD